MKGFVKRSIRFYESWYLKFDLQGTIYEKPDKETCEKFGVKGTESKKDVKNLFEAATQTLKELNENTAYREASFWEALKTVFNQS